MIEGRTIVCFPRKWKPPEPALRLEEKRKERKEMKKIVIAILLVLTISSTLLVHQTNVARALQYYLLTWRNSPPSVPVAGFPGEAWYTAGSVVLLSAPAMAGGYLFAYWDVDGVLQGQGINTFFITMDMNHTATAHYRGVRNMNTGLNYTTIQAAIDAPETLDGHTLSCYAGNYTENVHVNKSLKIIGAGPTLAYIIPFEPNDTVHIYATPSIPFEPDLGNFTIMSPQGYSAISLTGSNWTIEGNCITGNGTGIDVKGSSNNTITGNSIYSLPGNGIEIRDASQRNRITGNSLDQNHYGIDVRNASDYNVISDNFINSSDWSGIRLNWQGLNYVSVAFNNITNNIVCNNYEGITLDQPSDHNFVDDNFICDNYIGIRLRQANNTTVVHNTVISNSYRGISAESSYANNIDDNFLNNTNNAWDNGANNWNVTKQTGPNIIGGPYIGGNYWSDNPNPIDVDNDGIGDVPYNITGGTNKDYLPLVTQLPIFIASFMTPEGEPYPFDITISNGTSKVEFANATHIVTQWPENGTFTLVYRWYSHSASGEPVIDAERYQHRMHLQPGEIREFEFYAVDLSSAVMFRPYIYGKEVGANVSLSWEYVENASLSFHVKVTPSGKRAFLTVWTDTDLSARPNFAISSLGWQEEGQQNVTIVGPSDWISLIVEGAQAAAYIYDHLDTDDDSHYVRFGSLGWYWYQSTTTTWNPLSATNVSFTFAQIGEDKVQLGVRTMLRNDALVPYCYAFNMTLTNIKDGAILEPEFIYPQFAVSPGSYVLQFKPLSDGYLQLSFAINVSTAQILDVYPLKTEDLKPFSFTVAAESSFANSSYSNLLHNDGNKTLTVDVSTEVPSDWWGCFVLPRDRMVRALTAYSGSTSYKLSKFYNYTESYVGNCNIVCVRIPPEMDGLNLTYTVFGDIIGLGSIPDGKVDARDVALVASSYGSRPNLPRWNPLCDINYDFKVDVRDVAPIAANYGKKDS
jgi:parallel beta-helix repeat protein